MSIAVEVATLPKCDWAGDDPKHPVAVYDFKTKYGPWANGCHKCYHEHRAHPELGTGKGQKLYISDHAKEPSRPRPLHLARLQALISEHGSLEAALDELGVDGINVSSLSEVEL